MNDKDNELEVLLQAAIKREEILKAKLEEAEKKHAEEIAYLNSQPKIDQFSWQPPINPLDAAQVRPNTQESTESILGNVKSIREQANKTVEPSVDPAAARQAFMTSGVKLGKEQVLSVNAEMLEQAKGASKTLSEHDRSMAEVRKQINTMPEVLRYGNMNPNDPVLSEATMNKEMAKGANRISVHTDQPNNFFDNTSAFEFGGKQAHEARASAIEKKDYQAWLNTFQPAAREMKETQSLEKNTLPYDASDAEVKKMDMKHKFEQEFFKYQEKNELAKAEKLFPNDFKSEYVRDAIKPEAAGHKEKRKLHEAFKDYAAEKVGKVWQTTFKPDDPSLARKKNLFKKLDYKPQKAEVSKSIQEIRKGRTLSL